MTPAERLDAAQEPVDLLPPEDPNYAALHALVAIGRLLQNIDNRQTAQEVS